MKKEEIFKSYNFKMSKEVYLKLEKRLIEEQEKGENLTKNELLSKIILEM